jgi:hypothetical protein
VFAIIGLCIAIPCIAILSGVANVAWSVVGAFVQH